MIESDILEPQIKKKKKPVKKPTKKTVKKEEKTFGMAMDLDDDDILN